MHRASERLKRAQPFITATFFLLWGIAFYYHSKKEERLIKNYKMAVGEVYDYKVCQSRVESYFEQRCGDPSEDVYG